MGRENIENWHVKKCSPQCAGCDNPFADKEALYSRLSFDEGEYLRHDFCESCWERDDSGLSSWKTVFVVPPPDREEVVKKESAEALLRRLIAKDDEDDLNAIFILAVMLERKRILVERDVRTSEDRRKLRIYEHRKTGESLVVIDPELKLAELERVQEEVVVLLGGKSCKGEASAPDPEDNGDNLGIVNE